MKSIMMVCVGLSAGLLVAAEPTQPARANQPVKAANPANPGKEAKQAPQPGKDAKPGPNAQQAKSGKSVLPAKPGKGAVKEKQPTMTLSEAREYIDEVIKNPEKMSEITSQLSSADQNKFMIEVNRALAIMPGSTEMKTAKYLAVEREALLSANEGNLQSMVATMFSTVPLESLTVLAERYGEDLFNRDADTTKKFTDEQFVEIASTTVKEVVKECDGLVDAAPRDTLAVYLFEKSSNGSIPDLEDRLLEVAISDSQTREVAKGEWLAQAKSEGESSERFSSLLGYAEAGRAPNVDVTLKIAGPQVMTAMLNDLAVGVTDSSGQQIMPITQGENPTEKGVSTPGQQQAVTGSADAEQTPKTDAVVPWNPSINRNQAQDVKEVIKEAEKEEEEPEPEPGPEPKPYLYQD